MNNITGGSCGIPRTEHTTAIADPSVAAVAVKFPPNRYTQDEAIGALTDFAGPEFRRFALSSGVEFRNTALPLGRYSRLSGFTEANDAYIDVALDLAEQAFLAALDQAKVRPSEVDIVFSTTVTGLAVPTLEARLAARVGLRQDVERVPLFGLGCVAGAAGTARMHDYLRAFPDQVAALLAVELCSLTIQRKTIPWPISSLPASSVTAPPPSSRRVPTGLLRHAAVPGCWQLGAASTRHRRSHGLKIGSDGFRIVLSVDVATVTEKYLGEDVRGFLADHGLTPEDVSTWVCRPGGPRVIEAVENVLDLPGNALDHTRNSLRSNGNLSSVSVLDVLRANIGRSATGRFFRADDRNGPGFLLGARTAGLVTPVRRYQRIVDPCITC